MKASGKRQAIKMPWYVGSLSSLPQLTEALIAIGGRRISQALDYMHSKSLVHMDVKTSNILMDHNGDWFLADFGSSTAVGEMVWSFTRGWYPGGLSNDRLADPSIDWGLLFVTLIVLLQKDNLKRLLGDEDDSSVNMAKASLALNIKFQTYN